MHIWHIIGQDSNLGVFDVADNGELHDILWAAAVPDMTIAVTPLASHPSDIALVPDDGKV